MNLIGEPSGVSRRVMTESSFALAVWIMGGAFPNEFEKAPFPNSFGKA